jgi:hypothetical protein
LERKNGALCRIATVALLQLFLSTDLFAQEIPNKTEETDENRRESMTRFQIAREHHLLMQQIIDSLKEITAVLHRISKSGAEPPDGKNLEGQLDAVTKKVEELSEKHQRLMKAVDDLSKEANTKKKTEEDQASNTTP